MKKLILLFLALGMAASSWAYNYSIDFSANGLNYNISNKGETNVSVISCDSMYAGAMNIPSTVTDTATNIQYTVTVIRELAFKSCKGITSIVVPNTVTHIEGLAFVQCSNLTSITLPDSLAEFGVGAFIDSNNLASIILPKKLVVLPSETFLCNNSLTSLTLPEGLKEIGSKAFMACSALKSISIPASTTTIYTLAFTDCYALKDIYAYPTTPDSLNYNDRIFEGVDTTTCTLHVPKGSSDAYKAADVWKGFFNIVDDLPTSSLTTAQNSISKVTVRNGQAVITGTKAGTALSIYTLQGSAIYTGKTSGETQSIALPSRGVYIVLLGGKSVKVIY